MDRISKQILTRLQEDAKLTNQELADEVSLSPSPCLRRVKQLEDDGYIERYVALLNPDKLGLHLTVLVSVGLESHDPKILSQFEATIQSWPEVIQCYLIAGQTEDYLLKVITPDLNYFHNFLMKKLTQIKGVKNIHSSFVLKNIVNTTALPLNQLE